MHLHPVKTHVTSCFIVIFVGHFPQKSLIISGSFAENDLQLKASDASSLSCSVIQIFECAYMCAKKKKGSLGMIFSWL